MKHQNKVEHYLYQVVTGTRRGFWVVPVLGILTLLEGLYRTVLYYRFLTVKSGRLPVPVISIGNLMVGGTGKTPLTVAVAKLMQAEGLHPAILSRGYGGSAQTQGVIFDQGDLGRLGPEVTGDEPYLMARLLPGVFFGVGQDRYRMGRELLSCHPEIDLILLDDGFQHWKVRRDLDIVLIDGVNPFGNGHLLPRGLLREPLSALRRAGMVLITRGEQIDTAAREAIAAQVRRIHPTVPVALVKTENHSFTSLTSQAVNLDRLKTEKSALLTAIGNPDQFRTAVLKTGLTVALVRFFSDHHYWTSEEIEGLLGEFGEQGIGQVITTGKDGVKLERFIPLFQAAGIACYILNLEFKLTDPQLIKELKKIVMKKGD